MNKLEWSLSESDIKSHFKFLRSVPPNPTISIRYFFGSKAVQSSVNRGHREVNLDYANVYSWTQLFGFSQRRVIELEVFHLYAIKIKVKNPYFSTSKISKFFRGTIIVFCTKSYQMIILSCQKISSRFWISTFSRAKYRSYQSSSRGRSTLRPPKTP